MSDLISREDAIVRMDELCKGVACIECPFCISSCFGGCKVFEFIKTMPTIEAEPVKHGRWIPCTKAGMPLTEFGRGQGEKWFGYKCSECNMIYKGNALMESPHCQHCGAKMDEVEE